MLEPVKNYNNLIGVPYTILGLEADHEIAVLELGMNLPGELRRLAEIAAPSAALLTQIGLTHVGMFKSIDELVQAKLDLFRGCAPGTPLVINAGCPRTMAAFGQFKERHPITTFLGEDSAPAGLTPHVQIENVRPLDPLGYRFDCRLPGGTLKGLELRIFGRHHLANVAAAAALLHAAGLPPEWIADAIADFRTEPLRGEIIETAGMTLILDCYNASPPSMASALHSLAQLATPTGGGRRILILADMLELGDHSPEAHAMLLGPLRRLAPAIFLGLGPQCRELAALLASEGWDAAGFGDHASLVEAAKTRLRPGDQIFFKGSHGFGLEKVAQALAPELAIPSTEHPS